MQAMNLRRPWLVVLVLSMGLLACGLSAARADDKEKTQRQKLLELNGLSTEETQLARLRAMIKDRAKAKEEVKLAAKMVKEAKEGDNPFNYNASLILAKAAHILKMYDVAEKFYEHTVELATKLNDGMKMVNAYDSLIDLYWDQKRYADLIDTCEKIVEIKGPKEIEGYYAFALERLVQAKTKQGKIDEAMTITKGIMESAEGLLYIHFLELKGWIQHEDGKLKDAIATYNEAIAKLDADKEAKAEIKDKEKDRVRYILSGLYVDNKEIDKAAKQLETLVKKHPDNPTFKNDLGFIWCDHDMHLEESEKLIKEALALDKKQKEKLKEEGKLDEVTENAAYLDSLGWVYYKEMKYKEALEPLKKASMDEDEGNHLEIWDHLADCYMALGQKKEAVAAWEKGLKMEDVSPRDGERRRKVSEKLKKARLELTKE
jgi:tetratricopeptide (TPR) repeat protein